MSELLLATMVALIPKVEGIITTAQDILGQLQMYLQPVITRPDYEAYGGWTVGASHNMTKPIARIIVHHEGSVSAEGGSAVAIHRYHRSIGWAAIGYHFIIERDGAIREGRPMSKVGAHATGYNADSWGVCLIGNLDIAPPMAAQVASLTQLLQWLRGKHPGIEIVGHGELMATACPGKYLNLDAIQANLY